MALFPGAIDLGASSPHGSANAPRSSMLVRRTTECDIGTACISSLQSFEDTIEKD